MPEFPDLHQADRRSDRLALGLTLLGFAAALLLGGISDGFYHDDDFCHYRFAVDAWSDVQSMLHWWARPGYTIPAMFVARFFGLPGCRVFSALLTAISAWLAYCIARRVCRNDPAGRYVWIAPLLVWVQPLVMILAETTLTETPALFSLTLGTWLLVVRRPMFSAAVWSVLFVTRLELLAIGPLLAGLLAVQAWRDAGHQWRRAARTTWLYGAWALLLWAPVSYFAAAWYFPMSPEASPWRLFQRQYSDQYGQGDAYHYLLRWMQCSTLGVLVFFGLGAARVRARRGAMIWVLPVAVVLLHTLLYAFNSFASGGYARFLVPISGLVGATAAVGFGVCLSAGLPARRRLRGLGVAFAVLLLLFAQAIVQIRPLPLAEPVPPPGHRPRDPQLVLHALVLDCARAVAATPHADSDIYCTHVLSAMVFPDATAGISPEQWQRRCPPGTVVLWDSKYGGDSSDPESLWASLQQYGTCIAYYQWRWHAAAAFVRNEIPSPAEPMANTTQPTRKEP